MANIELKENSSSINVITENLSDEVQLNCNKIFTPEALKLIINLNEKLRNRRDQLLATRLRKQEHYDQGKYPEYRINHLRLL